MKNKFTLWILKKNKKSFISIYKLKIFDFLKIKLTYLYKIDKLKFNCSCIFKLIFYK